MAMHFLDGQQFFSRKEALDKIRGYYIKKDRKYFYVVKVEKPRWYDASEWKQTWTIRVKDYSKIKIIEH